MIDHFFIKIDFTDRLTAYLYILSAILLPTIVVFMHFDLICYIFALR